MRHLRRHRALALLATLLVLLISVPVMAAPLCVCDTCEGTTSCEESAAPEAEPAEDACCAEDEAAPEPERTAHPCECAFSSAPAIPAAAHPDQAALAGSPTLPLLIAAVPALVPTLFAAADPQPTVSPPIVSPLPEGGSLTIRLCALLR